MANFDAQKSECGVRKKVFPRIHIDTHYVQKTGSKLDKFDPCGPIYILQPPIGGRHPAHCLSTQITERASVNLSKGGLPHLAIVFSV